MSKIYRRSKEFFWREGVRNKLVMLILTPLLYETSVEGCCFSHPATTLPSTSRKQGFSCGTQGRKETASRRTVGWVVTEAAGLSRA